MKQSFPLKICCFFNCQLQSCWCLPPQGQSKAWQAKDWAPNKAGGEKASEARDQAIHQGLAWNRRSRARATHLGSNSGVSNTPVFFLVFFSGTSMIRICIESSWLDQILILSNFTIDFNRFPGVLKWFQDRLVCALYSRKATIISPSKMTMRMPATCNAKPCSFYFRSAAKRLIKGSIFPNFSCGFRFCCFHPT